MAELLGARNLMNGAATDPHFTAGQTRVRYSISTGAAQGPFHIEAKLWYQPIGYRWANNLKACDSEPEPARFNSYYDAMGQATAQLLAHASIRR